MFKLIADVLRNTAMFEGRDDSLADLVTAHILKTMREPTQEMLDALNACGGDTDAIWPAMIDAILSKQPEWIARVPKRLTLPEDGD